MVGFLVRRLLSTVLVLIGVSILVFLIMQLVPGDPVRSMLGQAATAERVTEVRHQLGLDRPLIVQYLDWILGVLHGDLGQSLTLSQPVSSILFPKLGNTMILAGGSLLICLVIGVPLGMVAARRQYSVVDRGSMFVALGGASVPVYWAGLVIINIFALKLGWFPTSGMYDTRNPGGFEDVLVHLVLPSVAAAVVPTAVVARMARGSMVEALHADHVQMLRASGVPERLVIWKHTLRNILPPVVNIVGLQAGYLLGGVIFVEVVFNWPGLGGQLYTSITAGDMPMIQAGVLFIALVFVVVNLVTDVAVALLDPRTRKEA
ncbi:MAG TPA: ABC transporter permease [Pseudonocardia sp.]|jgi:peptide/nickel transport system permease protein|uniref:ABC transporter permease n=1 Tax=Pseudonocardia sp. TaxID=60912 RepID=UPI002C76792B|nr:ABC transporter permease [Pseudonocardia sp.]HTF54812.1 ABC transporter permease [Pseudonocardia sp.]